jgi:hypothetical protein
MVFLSAGTATRALGQDEFRRDRIGTDVADGALAEGEELGDPNILHLELPEIQIASYRSAVVWWAFVEGGLGPNRRFQMGCRRVGVEPATFRL